MVNNPKIVIDPEFEALIPKLTPDEYKGLEEQLKQDGILDPLKVWDHDGKLILLDGHNRYHISQKLKDTISIPFTVEPIYGIESRNDAITWIIQNQLGRRNISDAVRAELALKLKPILEAAAKERMVVGGKEKGVPNLAQGRVRDEMAKVANVSHGTMDKVEDVLETGSESLKEAMRTKEASIDAAHTIAENLSKEEQDEVVSMGKRAIKEAAKDIKSKSKTAKPKDVRITKIKAMLDIFDHGSEYAIRDDVDIDFGDCKRSAPL